MKMNKRGLLNEVWIVLILFFVAIALVFGYTLFSVAAPVLVGEGKSVTSIISTNFGAGDNTTLGNATVVSVQTANGFLGMVELSVYLIFFGMLIGYFAVCYYVRTYKWLAVVWMMLIVALVVISMILSNTYQITANSNTDLAAFYQTWGTNDFLMNYLPIIVAGLGIISGIILFTIMSVGSDEETLVIT